MKKLLSIPFKFVMMFAMLMVTFVATSFFMVEPVFAQEVVNQTAEMGIPEAVGGILDLIATHKGSKYGTVIIIVQSLMLLFKTSLAQYAGKFKLLIVTLLSLVSSIVLSLSSGADFGVIISDATIVSALSVFFHQLYKQFGEKKD